MAVSSRPSDPYLDHILPARPRGADELLFQITNALFHAESTVLLRAARANGGSLAGQRFEVHTDRHICRSCIEVLPKLGQELGNPMVTFINPNGTRRTMRDGKWVD